MVWPVSIDILESCVVRSHLQKADGAILEKLWNRLH